MSIFVGYLYVATDGPRYFVENQDLSVQPKIIWDVFGNSQITQRYGHTSTTSHFQLGLSKFQPFPWNILVHFGILVGIFNWYTHCLVPKAEFSYVLTCSNVFQSVLTCSNLVRLEFAQFQLKVACCDDPSIQSSGPQRYIQRTCVPSSILCFHKSDHYKPCTLRISLPSMPVPWLIFSLAKCFFFRVFQQLSFLAFALYKCFFCTI